MDLYEFVKYVKVGPVRKSIWKSKQNKAIYLFYSYVDSACGFTFQLLDNNTALFVSNIEINQINSPKRPASKLFLILFWNSTRILETLLKGYALFSKRWKLNVAIPTSRKQTFALCF